MSYHYYPWWEKKGPPKFEQPSCASVNPEYWQPEHSHKLIEGKEQLCENCTIAVRICNRCPDKHACLIYGADIPYGIWGGMTVRERFPKQ